MFQDTNDDLNNLGDDLTDGLSSGFGDEETEEKEADLIEEEEEKEEEEEGRDDEEDKDGNMFGYDPDADDFDTDSSDM